MKKTLKTATILTMALILVVGITPIQTQASKKSKTTTIHQENTDKSTEMNIDKLKQVKSKIVNQDVNKVTGPAIKVDKNDVVTGSAITAKVILNKKEATIKVGKKIQLNATLKMAKTNKNNTVKWTKRNNIKLIWTSSDESVATVSKNGKVKGMAVGTAKIIASTQDGKYSEVCNITVKQLESK